MPQRSLHLSVGESFSSSVSTLETTWPRLCALLSDYVVSDETLEQFNALPKDAQLRLKTYRLVADGPGFTVQE